MTSANFILIKKELRRWCFYCASFSIIVVVFCFKKKSNKFDLLKIELDDLLWFDFYVVIKFYDLCCGFSMLNLLSKFFFSFTFY
jgi:hypothetical protein